MARSVIAASGASYRRLEVPRLERFEGVSVHYAATEAEAQRFEGEEVVVVGGGNSAGQAALFLAGRARRVYQLIRGDDLGKSMSRYLVERVTGAENVELLANTEVRELMGEDHLEGIVVEDNRSGARRTLGARALFVFIGAEANTGWLEGPSNSTNAASSLRGGVEPFSARGRRLAGTLAGAVPAGDEPAGGIRGGRRAQWLDQASGLSGRRGLYGGQVGPSVPGR